MLPQSVSLLIRSTSNFPARRVFQISLQRLLQQPLTTSNPNLKDRDENKDEKHKSTGYSKTEQSVSGTTNEIAHDNRAYDPSITDPHVESKEIGKGDKQKPLDWSGANERVSQFTDEQKPIKNET
ncbi:hypothetical protein G9A89_006600 [Geosiphon pyriformis]|nr:hypothetical protein G9A89_006600 [Geosiphon pyriformis]